MPYSKEYVEEAVLKAINALEVSHSEGLSDGTVEKFASFLYTPDQRLPFFLERLKEEVRKRNENHQDALSNSEIGKLMEQIAFLTFRGLSGHSSIKSFQSAGPQYDLIITGDTSKWGMLCSFLYLNGNRDFLVEVKAEKRKIGDPQFARLCSLMKFNLCNTSGIGVFFTLKGATGFPDSSPGQNHRRRRSLSDARLRQAIFMAACNKPIVVFDENDIVKLDQSGALIHLLREKIRDVEQLSGISIGPNIDTPMQCDLPNHLMELHNRRS